jgi:hypothetical protein
MLEERIHAIKLASTARADVQHIVGSHGSESEPTTEATEPNCAEEATDETECKAGNLKAQSLQGSEINSGHKEMYV